LLWRETFIDPSMGYDDGETIFLVEEPGVPNYTRQAVIAENGRSPRDSSGTSIWWRCERVPGRR
jgi:hypothetical protein